MSDTIFYSWQSDLPNSTNRSLIEDALNEAIKSISNDLSIDKDPRLDRDRQGVPGAPNIFQEILNKINNSAAAVFDVSIINLHLEDRISVTLQNIKELLKLLPDEIKKGSVFNLCDTLNKLASSTEPPNLSSIEDLIESLDKIEDEKKDHWQEELMRFKRILHKYLVGRPSPNPNVLVELGYSLKHLSEKRIILVINTAFGSENDLPFDLRQMALIRYSRKEGRGNRATTIKELAKQFEVNIRSILDSHIKVMLIDEAVMGIDNNAANKQKTVENYSKSFIDTLDTINNNLDDDSQSYHQDLQQAIKDTAPLITEFSLLAESTSLSNDVDVCESLVDVFRSLTDKCYLPEGISGSLSDSKYLYFRFISKSLFTFFIAALLKRRRWKLIEYALDYNYHHIHAPFRDLEGKLFAYIGSQHIGLNQETLEMFHKLFSQNNSPITIEEYAAADFFLCLRGKLIGEGDHIFLTWQPSSYLLMEKLPPFLVDIRSAVKAKLIAALLKCSDIDSLKEEYLKRRSVLSGYFRYKQLSKSQSSTWMIENRVLQNYQAEDIGKET